LSALLLNDKPWFLNWGKILLLYSSHIPLGVPNGPVIYFINSVASPLFSLLLPRLSWRIHWNSWLFETCSTSSTSSSNRSPYRSTLSGHSSSKL
jgi:hypothetical protein